MEIFVARQPIFDIHNNVVAYELLFRNGDKNYFEGTDGDSATLNVISNAFYSFGIKGVTGGKKAFINFTEKLLKEEVATILSPEDVTIEILENIEPTKEVIESCRKLKQKGYIIALDDFVFNEKYRELIFCADIIKVDFSITKGNERNKVFSDVNLKKIKFLAEKVETIEEFNEAKRLGYSLFQGYYFSKPIILRRNDIPANEIIGLKIMKKLNKKNVTLEELEELITRDVALSYKLLKLINSPAFAFKNRINSINNSIALIGQEELIKWLYVILMGNMKKGRNDELVNLSLVRAKFAENIFIKSGMSTKAFMGYITGMLSLMESILNFSMDSIISELSLPEDVNDALKGKDNYLGLVMKLIISYEKGDWDEVFNYTKLLNIDSNIIGDSYFDALSWLKNA